MNDSFFQLLKKEVDSGIEGKNSGIPMGFNRLNKYIGIRKRIMTLIFGSTGSGKTSFTHSAYILNPIDWYIENKGNTPVYPKILLFSMERSKLYLLAKWVSRRIFLTQGILLPIPKLLSWWENHKIDKIEYKLFEECEEYLDQIEQLVEIVESSQNPTGCYKYIKNYAEANGKIEQVDEFHKIYIPNNDKEIVIPIVDHLGLTRTEKGHETKKSCIDKLVEYLQWSRDFLSYSPVMVAQITRDLGNVSYQKMESFEPTVDQVKESGAPSEASDTILSLFDPLRYNTTDRNYDAKKFVNPETGAKGFRSINLLKSTYSEDSINIGMSFHGATGIFRELPKKQDMHEGIYEQVITGNYFLQ